MADSLLDQRDYQELQEQERLWQQPRPTEVTPLLQPEVQEQRTYNTELPPQMAEFAMDSRRAPEAEHPAGWVDSRGVPQELPPAVAPLLDLSPEAPVQAIQPLRLRPLLHVARDLCLWRNVRDSAVVFSAGLGLMGALSYFSLISIFAYLSLGVLIVAGDQVFGRQLFYALQQRPGVAHPFQRILQRDIVLDPAYLHEQLDAVLQPLNRKLVAMRNLYLADSLAETLKMMFYMYLLTYVGRYFNLMSLLMVGWVLAFSLPKLYMMFRPQLDRMWSSVRGNVRRLQMDIRDKFQQQKQRVQQRRDRRQSVEKKVTFEKTEKIQ
ncbi:LOW QUALITY PROTEIN: reticulon-3-A-like [Paramacrobiotus metropolitanus]|uniref:LOW QUALITY PROTEIN: reticulon-3-A-like n=1 Tax=Paramacrobiotus metropolitanus TaxID=2943436 RepID=UPI00244586F6|nr:LOW QUALITY PROTEIN: reticulon-3-A-like [Paramacrobiotus metropolitanus]